MREENKVLNQINYEFTEKNEVKAIYPQFYHGCDKQGRMIYYEQIGLCDMEKLWTATTYERMNLNCIKEFERAQRFRKPALQHHFGT